MFRYIRRSCTQTFITVCYVYRDYRNPDLVNEENGGEGETEEKFTPEQEFHSVSVAKRPATTSTRKRGKFSIEIKSFCSECHSLECAMYLRNQYNKSMLVYHLYLKIGI